MGILLNVDIYASETNQAGGFYPGDVVDGMITLQTDENVKARGVRFEAIGECDIHWTYTTSSGTGKRRRTTTHHCYGHETYLNHVEYVAGGINGDMMYPPGTYQLPFRFMIPPTAAPSLLGSVGKITYRLKAVLDRPWWVDKEAEAHFTVLSPPVVGHGFDVPQYLTNSKTLCCLCLETQPITAAVTLPKTGFAPGEGVPITAEITNPTNREMVETKAVIAKSITYYASNGRTKTDVNVIAEHRRSRIPARSSDVWSGIVVPLPLAIPPSQIVNCNLITVQYKLLFYVSPSGSFPFDVEFPLFVGAGSTVPMAAAPPVETSEPVLAAPGSGFGVRGDEVALQPAALPNYVREGEQVSATDEKPTL